jgi:hypothetical protein
VGTRPSKPIPVWLAMTSDRKGLARLETGAKLYARMLIASATSGLLITQQLSQSIPSREADYSSIFDRIEVAINSGPGAVNYRFP